MEFSILCLAFLETQLEGRLPPKQDEIPHSDEQESRGFSFSRTRPQDAWRLVISVASSCKATSTAGSPTVSEVTDSPLLLNGSVYIIQLYILSSINMFCFGFFQDIVSLCSRFDCPRICF